MEKEAIWIGYDWKVDCGGEPNRYYAFRKEYKFPSKPKRAICHITADSRFKLFINGVMMLRGPSRSTAHIQHYETVDIARFLKKGSNIMAVLVRHFGMNTASYIDQGRMGLWLSGKAEFKDREPIPILTDTSWEAAKADWYGQIMHRISISIGFSELFDARREPQGWMRNLSSGKERFRKVWFVGTTGCHPWWFMEPSNLKPLVEEERECIGVGCWEYKLPSGETPENWKLFKSYQFKKTKKALSTKRGNKIIVKPEDKAYAITFDFGYVGPAYPDVEIQNCWNGLVVDNYYHNSFLPQLEPTFYADNEGMADRFICKDKQTHWQSYSHRGYRYHTIIIYGLKREITLKAKSISTHYPVKNRSFKADNETINKIFGVSCHTLKCGMLDALVDNCWREQAEWMLDGFFSGFAAIASFGSPDLLRSGLINWGRSSVKSGMLYSIGCTNYTFTDICDYALWWVYALKRYYFLTGDIYPLEKTVENLIRLMNYVKAHSIYDGLFIPGPDEPVFIDWTDMDRMPHSFTLNLLALQAWESAAYIFNLLGKKKFSKEAIVNASKIRRVLEKRFWDNSNNAWIEHIPPSSGTKEFLKTFSTPPGSSVWHHDSKRSVRCPCSLHGNALSILLKLGIKKQREGAAELVKKALVPGQNHINKPSPIWTEVVFSSLFEAGEDKEALESILDWYGAELKGGYTAWPEHFSLDRASKIKGDAQQTVGSSINTVFVRYLLGIRCEDVGYKSVAIDIHDCGLKYAQGKVFTPYGDIDVEWERKNEKIYVKVKSPKEIRVRACSSKEIIMKYD